MDGEVRLLNDDDAGDAVGIEIVEENVDDGGFGGFGRSHHGFFDFPGIADYFGVAIVQFDEQMTAQSFQNPLQFLEISDDKSMTFKLECQEIIG